MWTYKQGRMTSGQVTTHPTVGSSAHFPVFTEMMASLCPPTSPAQPAGAGQGSGAESARI